MIRRRNYTLAAYYEDVQKAFPELQLYLVCMCVCIYVCLYACMLASRTPSRSFSSTWLASISPQMHGPCIHPCIQAVLLGQQAHYLLPPTSYLLPPTPYLQVNKPREDHDTTDEMHMPAITSGLTPDDEYRRTIGALFAVCQSFLYLTAKAYLPGGTFSLI